MQQFFLKRRAHYFILLEVFIALLLFSMMLAPFLTSPMKALKTSRNILITSELHRYSDLYLAKILKNKASLKRLEEKKKHKLEPITIDLDSLATYTYNAYYTLQTNPGKISNTTLVKTKIFFEPSNQYLPKIKPYETKFILKTEAKPQYNR